MALSFQQKKLLIRRVSQGPFGYILGTYLGWSPMSGGRVSVTFLPWPGVPDIGDQPTMIIRCVLAPVLEAVPSENAPLLAVA